MTFWKFAGHILVTCPTYHFAKQFSESSRKRDVLFFEWTQHSRLVEKVFGCEKGMGVCHGSDIEYVFGYSAYMNATDKQFSEDVMKMWTNFAKNR